MRRNFVATPSKRPVVASRRSDDPFACGKNFPVFEDAIRTEATISENTFDEYDSDVTVDSIYSHTSTHLLDLSIGARAALDEHLRHVAKFGIDDSHFLDRSDGRDRSFESCPDDPRDALWEKLVDPNLSMNNCSNILSAEMIKLINKATILQSTDNSHDNELENDNRSDFFDSSRVNFLQTPERYRSFKMNAISSRNEADKSEESSTASEQQLEILRSHTNDHPLSEPNISKNGVAPDPLTPGNNNSFLFSAADLSRISADGSEALSHKSSPDKLLGLRDRQTRDWDIGNVIPFTKDNINSRDNSPLFRSPLKRDEARHFDHLDPCLVSSGSQKKRSSSISPQFKGEENTAGFTENFTLSPIGPCRIRSRRQTTPESEPPLSTFAHNSQRSMSPSVSLGAPHSHISSMIAEYCSTPIRYPGSDMSPIQNSSSEKKTKDVSPGPILGYGSPTSASSTFLIGDRRRFRTVVPTRVFVNAFDDFPDQYDSFSAESPRRAQPSDSRTIKSTSW